MLMLFAGIDYNPLFGKLIKWKQQFIINLLIDAMYPKKSFVNKVNFVLSGSFVYTNDIRCSPYNWVTGSYDKRTHYRPVPL